MEALVLSNARDAVAELGVTIISDSEDEDEVKNVDSGTDSDLQEIDPF